MYLFNLSTLLKVILIVIYEDVLKVIHPSSPYLIAKQSRDAGFGGITYGCEVMTPLQGKHHPPARQTHQLPGQVAKAWTHRKWQQRGGRKREKEKKNQKREHWCWSSNCLFGYCFKKKKEKKWVWAWIRKGVTASERGGEKKKECTMDLLGAKNKPVLFQ